MDLKVLHCNDANCAGDDESITSPDTAGDVGADTSLALDGDGYPVVSYYDSTHRDLKVLHCDDANCSGGDESITSPDTVGNIGEFTSIALDASGFPIVSYHDSLNRDLKLLHCNDANCSGGDESMTSPDSTGFSSGWFTSLVLDGSDFPVVSYMDNGQGDLKFIHCNDATCNPEQDFDLDGCTDAAERQTSFGSETSGGRRNAKSFWDFFNPNRDGSVSGLDFFAVLARFNAEGDPGIDPLSEPPPAPAYHTAFDRTAPGMGQNSWDAGPPDGAISGIDFFLVLGQFNHSCQAPPH